MKSQCSICVELFERDSQIAATTCGHVFHYDCLVQWLHSQHPSTCPSCRARCSVEKNVVSHLYFDYADEDGSVDQSKLQNDLDAAKLAVREKEKEKQEIIEEKEMCKLRIQGLEQSKKEAEKLYAGEKAIVKELRKELVYFKNQIEEAQLAKQEAKRAIEKLKNLQNVQTMVNGCETDIEDMLKGQPSTEQLVTWCSVLQKELRTKKAECKQVSKELLSMKKTVHQQKEMVKKSLEQARVAEDATRSLESQNESLKRKLEKLGKAIASPSDTTGSFVHRMINESPMPMPSANKRPRLTSPKEGDTSIDMNVTMELFPDTPQSSSKENAVGPSPATKAKKDCEEYGTAYIKITSAASSSTKLQNTTNTRDANLPGFISQLSNMKGKVQNKSTVFREGYNGFGTHDKFIQPLGRPLIKKSSSTSNFKTSLKMAPRSQGKAPPLPSLHNFLSKQ